MVIDEFEEVGPSRETGGMGDKEEDTSTAINNSHTRVLTLLHSLAFSIPETSAQVCCSVLHSSEISVRLPRKWCILVAKQNISGSKHPNRISFLSETQGPGVVPNAQPVNGIIHVFFPSVS